jgi:4'-phosphopantetheinyl transferase
MPRLSVYSWPMQRDAAIEELTDQQLVVVCIDTTLADDKVSVHAVVRQDVRAKIRLALSELLGSVLACPAQQINLKHVPGQAPGKDLALTLAGHPIALSISHEQGLSVAAVSIGKHHAIGIDLVRIDQQMEWQSVAELYLGLQASAEISAYPAPEQAIHFARLWSGLEAKLKSHQRALTEWTPQLAQDLADCQTMQLDLPSGYAGTLALRAAAKTTT